MIELNRFAASLASLDMVFDIVYLRRKDDARGRSLASDPRIHLVQRKMLLEGATNPKTGKYMPGVIRKVTHRLEFPYRRDGCTKPEQIKEDLDSILRRRCVPMSMTPIVASSD